MTQDHNQQEKTAPPKRPAGAGPVLARIPDKPHDSYELLKRCLKYFIPHKWPVVWATVCMLLASLADAGTAYLVKPAMDEIFVNKKEEYLIFIPVAFLAVTLFKAGGRLLQNYLMQAVGLKVLERLRDEMYSKIIRLPMRFFESSQVGMLMSRILGDVVSVRASLPAIIMLVRQAVTAVALLFVVFYQDWQLALISLVALPLAFFPFVYFARRLRKLGRQAAALGSDVNVLLQEILSGIRVIKAFSTEKSESARFDQENRRLLRNSLKASLAGNFSSAAMELVGAVGIGLVLFVGGLKVIDGVSTPGTFFSFVAALALLYDPVKKASASFNDIQGALAGAERVFEVLDSQDIVEEKGGDVVLDGPFLELKFENVSFSYDGHKKALDGVNITVRAGERVALVGPSGAGKTTFVNLIPRFYDPDEGRILLNGIPMPEYTLQSLRSHVAVVSQDNFLFNQPVRSNIAYGQPELAEEKVLAAAKAAFADEFISAMPGGYDTLVGERGTKLSGGQKQRLTIARAIAKDAHLLILDEATSALDSEAEQIVQKALENLMNGRTSIVIAHRLSTVLGADRILVVEKGRIVAEGKHAELLQKSPLYAKLYAMQFGDVAA